MATLNGTARLKLRDGDWKTLGASRIAAASVQCATLAEGTDFEVDYYLGRVRRLRVVADGLHAFAFQYDDRAAEFAATESAQATAALLAQVVAAYQRLTQIQQQATALATQMAAIKARATSAQSMTQAQLTSVATLRQMAADIGTLADGLSGTVAAVSDEAVDIQFLARQIAASLGVKVTGA